MNKISATIVADSINQHGDRLTSLVLTYPRIIHAEMLTHRMFSRNASSSRAVPVQKMIEAVKNNTFCPFEFQKAHKGMQGSEYFTDEDKEDCIKLWLESAELALQQAEKMKEKGITKQIINRILEPYQYYTILITGSREGWNNFFELRCPSYEIDLPISNDRNEDWETFKFKSKKDLKKEVYSDEIDNYDNLEWLSINKGQAEIHMMDLAEKIYDAYNESTPKELKAGEWHIPFEDKIVQGYINSGESVDRTINKETLVKISTAMAARTSYTVVGEGKALDYEALIGLHDRLIAQNPPHSSPMEHCCLCVSEEEYNNSFKGVEKGWFRNYRGFKSYREIVESSR